VKPACTLARPANADEIGPGPGRRPLLLVQTWGAPSGTTGELILEPHRDHNHAWIRWGEDWDEPMSPEDGAHFDLCVLPVVRDVVAAFCCCGSLDVGSAELIREQPE
jgi:hypothetical protein